MRKIFPLFAVLVIVSSLATGCANTERKLGRGLSNTFEIVRLGEFRRTMEQSAFSDGPDYCYTTGAIHGFDRTMARTGLGLYEVVTCPFPTPGHGYDPICTDTFAPGPVYPDNYTPGLVEDAMFATDTNLGFSGGDVAPFLPGSRFRVFDTH
jgi:putative exosortase-associated protein (TIGR04073 family)